MKNKLSTNAGSFATAKLQAKKRSLLALLAIITIALTALPLAGCGNGNDEPTHTHQWGAWKVTTTCTLNPEHTDTRPIAALGHNYAWDNAAISLPSL